MASFTKKTPKKEQEDKCPYVVHWPHSYPQTQRQWATDYHLWLSIDPAIENYAIRLECRYHNGRIETIKMLKIKIPNEERVVESEHIISPIVSSDVPKLRGHMASSGKCKTVYAKVNEILDGFESYYDSVHIAVIERQLPINYQSTRVMQHTIAYLMLRLRNKPLGAVIIEVMPQLKGAILEFPGNDIKKESAQKAISLCRDRGDVVGLQIFDDVAKRKEKLDDCGDTVCQIEALCYVLNLPVTVSQQILANYRNVMRGVINDMGTSSGVQHSSVGAIVAAAPVVTTNMYPSHTSPPPTSCSFTFD